MPPLDDPRLRELLGAARTIAVVGIKTGPEDDAHRVPHYLQQKGYRVLPVSPKHAEALGETCVPRLCDLEETPDVVNLFRASAHIPAHTEEILALPKPPRLVWMQLGIGDEDSRRSLEAAGIAVVEDRCLMVEHARLLGRGVEPLVVPVYFDFASTVCYVTHRVMERMAPTLERLDLRLAWQPIDLAVLCGYERGGLVSDRRRDNAQRVAAEMDVSVIAPPVWLDSRAANAASLLVTDEDRAATLRERLYTAIFEEHRDPESAAAVIALGAEIGLALLPEAIEAATRDLRQLTLEAAEAQVTGVPTFMLGTWPFGGIQQEPTMEAILERFADRARRGALP